MHCRSSIANYAMTITKQHLQFNLLTGKGIAQQVCVAEGTTLAGVWVS